MANVNYKTKDDYPILQEGSGDPDGSVSGVKGQLYRDTNTGYVYRNTNGTPASQTTSWEKVLEPDHFSDTDNPHSVALSDFTITDANSKFTSTDPDGALDELSQHDNDMHSDTFATEEKIKDKLFFDDRWPGHMPTIRNEEMNNLLSTSAGTPITVSTAPSSGSIVLSWLPYIESLWNPTSGKEWCLMNLSTYGGVDPSNYGDAAEILKITGGTYATNTLEYDETDMKGTVGDWSVSDKVMLFNPMEVCWARYASNPIIEMSGAGWRSDFVLPGPVFRQADGTYIMLVNGTGDSLNGTQVGAFSSSDLESWSVMNSDSPVFAAGGSDWRANAIFCSSIVKSPFEPDLWLAFCHGYNDSDGKYRIGLVKFNEDFSHVEYSDSEIITSPAGVSYTTPAVFYFRGKFLMMYVDRSTLNPDTSTDPYECHTATATQPDDFTVQTTGLFDGRLTNDGHWRSSHVDFLTPLLLRGRHYVVCGGTSRYSNSGLKGNRSFGVLTLNETPSTTEWVEDIRNPIMVSMMYGDETWDDGAWENNHLGGAPKFYVAGGYLYMFYSARAGFASYRIGMMKYEL